MRDYRCSVIFFLTSKNKNLMSDQLTKHYLPSNFPEFLRNIIYIFSLFLASLQLTQYEKSPKPSIVYLSLVIYSRSLLKHSWSDLVLVFVILVHYLFTSFILSKSTNFQLTVVDARILIKFWY